MRSRVPLIAGLSVSMLLLPGCPITDPTAGQSITDLAPSVADYRLPSTAETVTATYRFTPDRRVDIYPASAENASGIAVVYLHGGGWVENDRSLSSSLLPSSPFFQYLIDAGHVGFSIDYTLARDMGVDGLPADCSQTVSPYPDNLDDVKWAIGWANQDEMKAEYGYTKVVVVGESAGGHLAGLAGVTSDQRPIGLPSTYNIRPDAVITLVAPVDMTTLGEQGPVENPSEPFEVALGTSPFHPVQCFYGPDYDPAVGVESIDMPLRKEVSVHTHVDVTDPPFFIVSGLADDLVPAASNGDVLEKAYIELGGDFGLRAWNQGIEGGNHLSPYSKTNAAAVATFMTALIDGDFD